MHAKLLTLGYFKVEVVNMFHCKQEDEIQKSGKDEITWQSHTDICTFGKDKKEHVN